LPECCATVVIPTLHAGAVLAECVLALTQQTRQDFEVTIVDNSRRGAAQLTQPAWRDRGLPVRILDSRVNLGFGGAVNWGAAESRAPYIAVLNDDAVAAPGWLEALVAALESRPQAGMAASRVYLAGTGLLDSAGMLLCADGSSRQRGHRRPADEFRGEEEVLLPSACAALYRRVMLDEIGWFDDRFFLYVEDTDVGLRGRWAGWSCVYVPAAEVEHRYSLSSGRASPLKAYYVERNRLFLVAKTFPARMALRAPLATLARYRWHVADLFRGSGAAASFRDAGHSPFALAWIVLRAHASLLWSACRLWRERRRILARARISPAAFRSLASRFAITPREVAEL
jgi:GT2 family glycosyltransferase